jgi:cytochrome b pre-mRNA-processing protein 3
MLKEMIGFGRSKARAQALNTALVQRARAPVFFRDLGVADTVDGRFDMVVAHAWLVLTWLNDLGQRELAQTLVDTIFTGFDEGVRELGVGDMGAGHRVKKIADAFYGRLNAYSSGNLAEAVLRNVYRGDLMRNSDAAVIANYLSGTRKFLSQQDLSTEIDFGPLPNTHAP